MVGSGTTYQVPWTLSTTGEEEAKLEQETDRRRSAPFTTVETTDHDGTKQAFTISEVRTGRQISLDRYVQKVPTMQAQAAERMERLLGGRG